MKYVYWILGTLLGIALLFIGAEKAASERIEVVELHTLDEAGEEVVTRLWVVDDEGYAYLRVGSDGSGWFSRLQSNGEFGITRGGEYGRYSAVLRTEKSELVNALMQEKYTWGDDLIAMMVGSREGSIPIELHPLP